MSAVKTLGLRSEMEDLDLPAAALHWAKRGFHVVPLHGINARGDCTCRKGKRCDSAGKHPRISRWQKEASAEEATVRKWWKRWPEANIGLATGGTSRLVALDIDGPKGSESLRKLEQQHGELPATLTLRSGRSDGGEHRVFLCPDELDLNAIRNRAGEFSPGLDTRAHGGQIAVAPSRHASGNRYAVAHDSEPAELPAWLYSLMIRELSDKSERRNKTSVGAPLRLAKVVPMERHLRYVQAALDDAGKTVANARKGERNQVLNRQAYALGGLVPGGHLEEQTIYDVLTNAAATAGLSGSEIDTTIASGIEAGKRAPRSLPERSQTSPNGRQSASKSGDPFAKLALDRKEDGRIRSTLANIETILSAHPAWKNVLRWNLLSGRTELTRQPPSDRRTKRASIQWADVDDTRTAIWLQQHGIPARANDVAAAVESVARYNEVHPVRSYLESLKWDGTERLEQWLTSALGTKDTSYHRAVGAKWAIGAVARILKPGCKADHMLVLEGSQGLGKSTAARILAGDDFFTDDLGAPGSKAAVEQIQGAWICEFAELDALTRAEVSAVKAFLTRTCDRIRPAYGRRLVDWPRQCVFIGTVNNDTYITDPTGGRRFWPVRVGSIDLRWLRKNRDQLWAEAVDRYHSGERWWLDGDGELEARREQEQRTRADVWESKIVDYIRGRSFVTVEEILSSIGIHVKDMKGSEAQRVGQTLTRLGGLTVRPRRGGKRVRGYEPGPDGWRIEES